MRNVERTGLALDTVDRLVTTTRAVRMRIDRERPVEPALLVVGYYTGDDFTIAPRRPVEEITYWDTWKVVR